MWIVFESMARKWLLIASQPHDHVFIIIAKANYNTKNPWVFITKLLRYNVFL